MPGMPRVEAYVLIDDQGMVMQLSTVDVINVLAALNAADEAAYNKTEYGRLHDRINEAFAPHGYDRRPPETETETERKDP